MSSEFKLTSHGCKSWKTLNQLHPRNFYPRYFCYFLLLFYKLHYKMLSGTCNWPDRDVSILKKTLRCLLKFPNYVQRFLALHPRYSNKRHLGYPGYKTLNRWRHQYSKWRHKTDFSFCLLLLPTANLRTWTNKGHSRASSRALDKEGAVVGEFLFGLIRAKSGT